MTIPKLVGVTASTPGPNVLDTYKVMLRHQNSHALVNAGFALTLSSTDPASATVTGARIFYGGVGAKLFRASSTEKAMTGVPLNASTLEVAQAALVNDIKAVGPAAYWGTTDSYRRTVAAAFLYKLFVRVVPDTAVAAANVSAGSRYVRPVSTSTATFPAESGEAPVGDPIIKLSALQQTSGEAQYVFDTNLGRRGLQGALAVTDVATGTITAIDTTAAAAMPGVVRILTVADIPSTGSNDVGAQPGQEKLFLAVGDQVFAQGQSVALVLADTFRHAYDASLKVKITTAAPTTPPVFTIADALAKGSLFPADGSGRLVPGGIIKRGDATTAIAAAKHQFSGTISLGGAKHFYMEVQNASARMADGEVLEITASTQSPSLDQLTATKVTGLPQGRVVSRNRRSGGGFGGKATRNIPLVASASLAAVVTGCEVHVQLDRGQDLRMTGGRENMYAEWSIGTDDDGVVAGYSVKMYTNGGAFMDGGYGDIDMGLLWSDNCYYFENYYGEAQVCRTNRPAVTSMRAPGVPQSVYVIERVMLHVANALGKDVDAVRASNFLRVGETTPYGQTIKYLSLPTVWQQLQDQSQYATLKAAVDTYNGANRWRKRGIAMTPLKYGIVYNGYDAQTLVNVFADGSINVSTSGTELGQGLYTKVAQAVAMALTAPLDVITVSPTNTSVTPSVTATGGSGTSEACVKSALLACAQLNTRLEPYRKAAPASATWAELVASANGKVDLSGQAAFNPSTTPTGGFFDYYGGLGWVGLGWVCV